MNYKVLILVLLAASLFAVSFLNAEDLSTEIAPPSSPPTNLVAVFNNIGETITVSWEEASANATYFIVEFRRLLFSPGRRYSDWQQIGISDKKSIKHSSVIMENSYKTYYGTMVYYYRVKACNSTGCSDYSDPTSIIVLRQRYLSR